jgi:protein TonB
MSARRVISLARWTAGLTLALGLHGTAAFLLLSRWHAEAEPLTSAPAILVDFAPEPAASAVTPTELPPAPQQQQQQQQQAEPKPVPDKTVAKIEEPKPPEKPVEKMVELPPELAPAPLEKPVEKTIEKTVELPPKPTLAPTIDVLPPRRPVEARHESKPRHRQASRASAPASAPRRAMRTAALAPGASAHDPNAAPNWRSAVVAQIERHKRYPQEALARGEHGVAQVAFRVDRRGGVHDVRIVRSSGSALLDRDALAWLRRAQPLPPPPPEIRGARVFVTVPLRYDIR